MAVLRAVRAFVKVGTIGAPPQGETCPDVIHASRAFLTSLGIIVKGKTFVNTFFLLRCPSYLKSEVFAFAIESFASVLALSFAKGENVARTTDLRGICNRTKKHPAHQNSTPQANHGQHCPLPILLLLLRDFVF